jgi:hypothetical protein
MLGEFEYLLLSAAARLGEDAYGATIRHEIENTTQAALLERSTRLWIIWKQKA